MAKVRLDDVEVPGELLDLLGQSRLSARDRAGQVRVALAIHLFITGSVSLGRAAELAGERRSGFVSLLKELGVPVVLYGKDQYQKDIKSIEALERQQKSA